MAKSATATYVYCLVSAARRPSLAKVPRGNQGLGKVRLLGVRRGLWLVVADARLDRYSEAAINRGLSDLDWVSKAAVAHEAVVESFIGAAAVVPMKLFTIFTTDARALEHLSLDTPRIDAVLKRVTNHVEWGVRVALEPPSPNGPSNRRVAKRPAGRAADSSGAAFLARKKSQRDALIELTARARGLVDELYETLAAQSRLTKRRTAAELPAAGGRLLMDAAFLVPQARAARFRRLASGAARDLGREGYRVTCSGPWPAYSFIQE
jgi:hypothetical protein